MSEKIIIPWDLGATKCASAIVKYDEDTRKLKCLKHHIVKLSHCKSFNELVEKLEAGLNIKMSDADAICIGAAGQYDGHQISLEAGYPYPMNVAEIAMHNNWPKFIVVHDYTPIVCATFTSYMDNPDNIKTLHRGIINPCGRRVAVGVGTGLGVKDGIKFPNGDFWLGINEMGHIGITYPPLAEYYYLQRHREMIRFLRREGKLQQNEPLTFEKILSGKGIARLHNFVYRNSHGITPEEVGRQCQNGTADETIAMFAWYLGLFIGTMQLSFMPSGGIWITGGVVLKNMKVFDHPDFYRGIQASPAYQQLRSDLPLGVLCNPEHAFLGGAYYAVNRLISAKQKVLGT